MTVTEHGIADDFDAPAVFDPAAWGWVPPAAPETAEFANPYHDERGRFAPKDTGRRVPTKGIDDGEFEDLRKPDPNQGSLFGDTIEETEPESSPAARFEKVSKWPKGVNPPEVPKVHDWKYAKWDKFIYETDAGTTAVLVQQRMGVVDPESALGQEFIREVHAHDPNVGLIFSDRLEAPGAVNRFWPGWIVIGARSQADEKVWQEGQKKDPKWFMPASKKVSMAQYVIAHEMGHVLHFSQPDGGSDAANAVTRYLNNMLDDYVSDRVRSPSDDKTRLRTAGLSSYAMTQTVEAIAEAHAQASLDPEGMTPELQGILDVAGITPSVKRSEAA